MNSRRSLISERKFIKIIKVIKPIMPAVRDNDSNLMLVCEIYCLLRFNSMRLSKKFKVKFYYVDLLLKLKPIQNNT